MELSRLDKEFMRRMEAAGYETYLKQGHICFSYGGKPNCYLKENDLSQEDEGQNEPYIKANLILDAVKEYVFAYEAPVCFPPDIKDYQILAASYDALIAAKENGGEGDVYKRQILALQAMQTGSLPELLPNLLF